MSKDEYEKYKKSLMRYKTIGVGGTSGISTTIAGSGYCRFKKKKEVKYKVTYEKMSIGTPHKWTLEMDDSIYKLKSDNTLGSNIVQSEEDSAIIYFSLRITDDDHPCTDVDYEISLDTTSNGEYTIIKDIVYESEEYCYIELEDSLKDSNGKLVNKNILKINVESSNSTPPMSLSVVDASDSEKEFSFAVNNKGIAKINTSQPININIGTNASENTGIRIVNNIPYKYTNELMYKNKENEEAELINRNELKKSYSGLSSLNTGIETIDILANGSTSLFFSTNVTSATSYKISGSFKIVYPSKDSIFYFISKSKLTHTKNKIDISTTKKGTELKIINNTSSSDAVKVIKISKDYQNSDIKYLLDAISTFTFDGNYDSN